jgi:quinolinate synthase
MAETAAILARPEQKVHIPDPGASCVMADMAPAPLVETVITALNRGGRASSP